MDRKQPIKNNVHVYKHFDPKTTPKKRQMPYLVNEEDDVPKHVSKPRTAPKSNYHKLCVEDEGTKFKNRPKSPLQSFRTKFKPLSMSIYPKSCTENDLIDYKCRPKSFRAISSKEKHKCTKNKACPKEHLFLSKTDPSSLASERISTDNRHNPSIVSVIEQRISQNLLNIKMHKSNRVSLDNICGKCPESRTKPTKELAEKCDYLTCKTNTTTSADKYKSSFTPNSYVQTLKNEIQNHKNENACPNQGSLPELKNEIMNFRKGNCAKLAKLSNYLSGSVSPKSVSKEVQCEKVICEEEGRDETSVPSSTRIESAAGRVKNEYFLVIIFHKIDYILRFP